MKKLVMMALLLALGYYLFQGPLAPLLLTGEFPLATLTKYEDGLLDFHGSKGVPKGDIVEGVPARTEKGSRGGFSDASPAQASQLFF